MLSVLCNESVVAGYNRVTDFEDFYNSGYKKYI